MTREEHVRWAKDRAMEEYRFSGRPASAVASLVSDLGKHDETCRSAAAVGELGMRLVAGGHMATERAVADFVEGVQ